MRKLQQMLKKIGFEGYDWIQQARDMIRGHVSVNIITAATKSRRS
jgi:hypothetical protein